LSEGAIKAYVSRVQAALIAYDAALG
jgi:hypothetical protein